ncbi:MAG: hypothetical protein RL059_860 [Bacteroidota bacterium]
MSFKDQITGVDEPEEEPPEDHPVEFYAPLVGTRHIDPKNGLTYQTVDIKTTPNQDIVSYRIPHRDPSMSMTSIRILRKH